MYVHAETGLVFLANPRTASRATAKALLGIGFELVGSHHSGFETHPRQLDWMGFCTVRDELQTRLSWARHLDCAPDDVGLRLPRNRPIIPGWTEGYFPHVRYAGWLLQYERLEHELNLLLEAWGLPSVQLERIG